LRLRRGLADLSLEPKEAKTRIAHLREGREDLTSSGRELPRNLPPYAAAPHVDSDLAQIVGEDPELHPGGGSFLTRNLALDLRSG
jgi:hypothetical protein